MRILRIILVLAVLVGFPLGSWIYLNKGLKWRLEAQRETAVLGALADVTLVNQKGERISSADLRGRYHILAKPADQAGLEVIRKIHQQFSVRDDYQTLLLLSDSLTSMPGDSVLTVVQCEEGCAAMEQVAFEAQYTAAILDDSLRIRGRYVLGDDAEARALVMHMAVVLPIPKREKIELKRGE